jgi:hypothetical protein
MQGLLMCLVAYTNISGTVDYNNVEGTFQQKRFNILEQREEWLIDANDFMVRTGLRNELNPGFVWADATLCLKIGE